MAFHQAANSEKEYLRQLRRKLNKLKIKSEAVKEISEVLGHGTYAKVVLLDVYGIRCAGEKLHTALFETSNEEQSYLLDKFAEECVRMGQLRHPNIVQLIGVAFSEDSITLVMEHLPISLTEFVEDYEDIPEFTKGSILLDIANGLNYLHQQNPPIIHRDMSTNNVLLTESLRAKISDFGVTKTLPPTAADGTALLMSLCPEGSLNEAEYNTQMDCFSFGNILVQVVVQRWLGYLVQADPEAPNQLVSSEERRHSLYLQEMVDHPLYSLAVQCLQDDPAQRPTSVEIVRKVKVFAEKNPPSFIYPVDMWSAYLESNEKVRHLEVEVAEMKRSAAESRPGGQGASCSFEKLKVHVRALEDELIAKKKEIQNRDKEIAAHKSTILSLKKLLTSMKGQDQPDGVTDTARDGQAFTKDSRPVPPTREKPTSVSPPTPRPRPRAVTYGANDVTPTIDLPQPRPRSISDASKYNGILEKSGTPPKPPHDTKPAVPPLPTQPTTDLPQLRPRAVSDATKYNGVPEKSVPPPKPPRTKPAVPPHTKPAVPPHRPRVGRATSPYLDKAPAFDTSPHHVPPSISPHHQIPASDTSVHHVPSTSPHHRQISAPDTSVHHVPSTSPHHRQISAPDTSAHLLGITTKTPAPRTSPYHDKTPAPRTSPYHDKTPAPRTSPYHDKIPAPRTSPYHDKIPAPRTSPYHDKAPPPCTSPYHDKIPAPRTSPYHDKAPAPRTSPYHDKAPPPCTSPYHDKIPAPRTSPYHDKAPAPRTSPYHDKIPAPRTSPYHDKAPAPRTSPYHDKTPVPDTSPYHDKIPAPRTSPYHDKAPAPRTSPYHDKAPAPRTSPYHDKTPVPDTSPYHDPESDPDTSPFYDKLSSFAPLQLEFDDFVDPSCYEVPIPNSPEKDLQYKVQAPQYETPLLPSDSKPMSSLSKPENQRDQAAVSPKYNVTDEQNKPTRVQKQNVVPRSQKPLPPLPKHAKPQAPLPPPRPRKVGGDPNDPELQMLLARRQQMISEDTQGKLHHLEKQRRQPTTSVKDEGLVSDPELRERLARQQERIFAAQKM